MNKRKILSKLTIAGIFDMAKVLHVYFPKTSTKRINDLILQVDSVDIAIDVLFTVKNSKATINELVYDILHYRDNK